jgi:hypothetical protein
MKLYNYLNPIINRIRRYSQKIEVSEILCNKPWIVFNDTGDKEVYMFQSDGSVLVTNNGIGVKTTWEWIPTNNSLIINRDISNQKSIIMLHPKFVNPTILALEQDGTDKYTFLIDENNRQNFAPKTLSELNQYFLDIEQKAIEAERQRERQRLLQIARIEEEKRLERLEADRRRLEEERRKTQEAEKRRVEEQIMMLRNKAYKIENPISLKNEKSYIRSIYLIILAIIIIVIIRTKTLGKIFDYFVGLTGISEAVVFGVLSGLVSMILLIYIIQFENLIDRYIFYRKRYFAKKYIKKHPNDPVNKFLESPNTWSNW